MKRFTTVGIILIITLIFSKLNAQPINAFKSNELKVKNITATSADFSWNLRSYQNIRIVEVLIYDYNTDTLVYKNVLQDRFSIHVEGLTLNTSYKWTALMLNDTIAQDLDAETIATLPNTFKTLDYTVIGLGIGQTNEAEKESMSAYTKGVDGMIIVNINNREASLLTVCNLSGQIVYNETISETGNLKRELDFVNKAKGLYLINFRNKSTNKTIKVSL